MPRGDKSKYTDRQKRKAQHIEEGYEKRGVAENRDLVLPVTLYENGTPHASITFDLVLERA